MRNLLVLIIATIFFDLSIAQSNKDAVNLFAASSDVSSVPDLHNQLIQGLTSDKEKIKAFYDWIAHHINYDVTEATRSFRSPEKQEAENVLKTKKAVCHGYSALFKELCYLSGIKCYLVSGFSKLNGVFDESGHTWNLVFIDGSWFQIDVTWAAGGVSPQRKYVKQFSDKYFLAGPDEFLAEHYPFDPMWQLKEYPVNLKEYKKKSISDEVYSASKIFHFNDTIAEWESKDNLQRLLSSAQRMNRFNAGNEVIEQELAFALLENGNGEFEKGNKILAELYPKNSTGNSKNQNIKPGSEQFIIKLDSAEHFFINADSYYKQVKLTDPNENKVLQNNRKALNNNLSIVRRELSNYKR